MDGIGVAANIVATVDLSAKVASLMLQYSEDANNAGYDIHRLHREVISLENVLISIRQLVDRPDSARLLASSPLINAINESRLRLDRLYEELHPKIAHQAEEQLVLHSLRWPFESNEVETTVQDLERCTYTISLALQANQTPSLPDANQKAALIRLQAQIAAGASFDSRDEQYNSRCLPGTRHDLLSQVSQWIGATSVKPMFWLNAMAGTGKSTISRTVAELLARKDQLGASFFFKRGEPDRSTIARLFPTIAADLAGRDPTIAHHVGVAIESNPTIFSKTSQEQFDMLVLQPLSMIQRDAPLAIVIDALDECDNDKDIKHIIHLLSKASTIGSVQLKIFLTSRPELPIRLGFNAIEGVYQNLLLRDIPAPIVERDLYIFLRHELANIRDEYNILVPLNRQLARDWPTQPAIHLLVSMVVPLFIHATIICRFISNRSIGRPDDLLNHVLLSRPGSRLSKLEAIYLPILDRPSIGLSAKQGKVFRQRFRKIVGSISILAIPLPISTLSTLLNLSQDIIANTVDLFQPVLSVPSSVDEPVKIYHLSFTDFLLHETPKHKFWVDEIHTHLELAASCLRLMHCLRQDICNLKELDTARSVVDIQKINANIPPEVRYACLFWVHHIQGAREDYNNYFQVYDFLRHHFLHWIEALSLMGRAGEIIHLVKELQLLSKDHNNESLSEFLNDAETFILSNNYIIDETPLQIYSSSVAYSLAKSKVKATFNTQVARQALLEPYEEIEPDLEQVTQEAFDSDLESLFSAPGNTNPSSRTSHSEQLGGVVLLIDLLYSDGELHPLYRQAMTRVSSGKFKNHLFGFFRQYGEDLEKEASDDAERIAARFVRKNASYVSQRIDRKLHSEGTFPLSLPSHDKKSSRQFVTSWLSSTPGLLTEHVMSNDVKQMEADKVEEDGNEDIIEDPSAEEVLYQMRQFLVDSEAFSRLKSSLRSWLRLDKPDSDNEELIEEWLKSDIGVRHEDDVSSVASNSQNGLFSRFLNTSPSLAHLHHKAGQILRLIKHCGIGEPSIPLGYQRVRWVNKRGQKLYDDYVEHEVGALRSLQVYLDTIHAPHAGAPEAGYNAGHIHSSSQQATGNGTSTPAPSRNFSRPMNQGPKQTSDALPNDSQNDLEMSLTTSNTLFLSACLDKGIYKMYLHQQAMTDITDDRQFFRILQKEVQSLRGRFLPVWSLRTVQSIHFMKFVYGGPQHVDLRCHDEICELGEKCKCVPPADIVIPTGCEYECSPIPAKLSPPIGPRLLMDFFMDPDSVPPDSTRVLRQLPKKRGGELQIQADEDVVAWGIYLKDGWNYPKIWWIVGLGFFPPSLLFGILWGVLNSDIQGAFGIASWWMTGAAIVFGIVGSRTWR